MADRRIVLIVNESYKIEIEPLNAIVYKAKTIAKGKNKRNKTTKRLGFFGSLTSALKCIRSYMILDNADENSISTIDDYIEHIEKEDEKFLKNIKEIVKKDKTWCIIKNDTQNETN